MLMPSKSKGREDAREVRAGLAHRGGVALHLGEAPGAAVMAHLLVASFRGDDLRALDQFVAEAMVAVGMRIDEGSDLRGGGRLGAMHRVEHLAGQLQVEQRIDQQRLSAIDHQTGVAPSP